ncbi:MAG: hypothetical protein H5T73_05800 [Actinobacteria bacterium]|nr:hypothetical protein [Actinomycetota bacterium]
MRIGIPRALMFYRYYPFLKTFVEGCGHEVVTSPPTDLGILEKGTECCVDDICVAVKAFFGHVDHLKDGVDALLVPRLVSVEKRRYDTFTCPKLIAAPDMVRFFPHRPPLLLEWVLDVKRAPWWWGCLRLGGRLGATPCRVLGAYREARREQARYEALLRGGSLPHEAIEEWESGPGEAAGITRGAGPRRAAGETAATGAREARGGNGGAGGNGGCLPPQAGQGKVAGDITVAVLGHPYLLGDGMLNKNLFRWLRESGARVLTNSAFSDEDLEREARLLPDISWSFERELLAAASLFSRRCDVDGIIYLTSFGCGPDSLVMEMFRRETLPRDGKAFMEVVLDEHSAESGVRTRAEAFVDMLRYRETKKAGGRLGAEAVARARAGGRT